MLLATFVVMSGAHYKNGFCSRGKGLESTDSKEQSNPLTFKEKLKLVFVSVLIMTEL